MKKQVVLYSGIDSWECKLCIFSEKVTTEKDYEQVYICHKNRFKFSEKHCPDMITNDMLIERIKKEGKK